MTPEQIATCIPALQSWSTALGAAQTAVSSYATALTAAQKQLSKPATTGATGATGGTGSAGGSGGAGAATSSPTTSSTAAKSAATGSTATKSTAGSGTSAGTQSTAGAEESQEAKVLSDQATITAAEQAVTAAQANLDASTLVAPIGGVVGAIGLTPGQAETSSTTISIVGDGAATVTVPVPLAKLPSISVGQTATVNPPGLGVLKGSVTQIALLPASTTGAAAATVTYDVTVTLPTTPTTLATGSYASTTITTAQVANVLTVPVSAVPGSASGSTRVAVLKDGVSTPTAVTVGAVGGGLAEIRSGLTAGDQVILADVSSALPTNSTTNVRGLTGGNGPGGAGGAGGARTGTGGAAPGR